MSTSECFIWPGHPASGYFQNGPLSESFTDSPRTDGGYIIDAEPKEWLRELSEEQKARLTTWLVDQRAQGVVQPRISRDIFKYIEARPPLSPFERVTRLLEYLAHRAGSVGTIVKVIRGSDRAWRAYACSESTMWEEVDYFLIYLNSVGWVERMGQDNIVRVTLDGYRQIAEQKANADSSQAFVAMWFDDSVLDAYKKGIEPGIKQAGYKSMRIDQKEDVSKVDDEIIAEIRRSRFLVADFTQGEDGARGGVYFEAGFAFGLNIPIIYTCRKDMVEKLAFDTRQYNHILWETPEELRGALANRISARFGDGPLLQEGSQ